jgi:hypothetical protein
MEMEKEIHERTNLTITDFSEILDNIPEDANTINLASHMIKYAYLEILPMNIKNIILTDNMVNKFTFDSRQWGLINLKNNGFSVDEIIELNCNDLVLDDNKIEEISFVRCNINKLFIVNCGLKNINFYDCQIYELNISENLLNEITTLPNNLVVLEAYSNYISKINVVFGDDLKYIDLTNNELFSIPNIPKNLDHLDLSQNNFVTIDTTKFPSSMTYFDITGNNIKNNKELFNELSNNIGKIFYDDSEDEDSDSSIDIKSINLNGKKMIHNQINLDSTDDEDTIDETIAQYYKDKSEENETKTSDEHEKTTELSEQSEMEKRRELFMRAAMLRMERGENKENKENKENIVIEEKDVKVYSECIPIQLQWRFVL